MDQLTAYQTLGLEPGSSMEEIRAAYARLSKEFHPEEHPEEFQRIHEAYSMLARGARRGSRQRTVPEEYHRPERQEHPEQVKQPEQTEQPKQAYGFNRIQRQPEPAKQQEYRFDQALERAQAQEQNQKHQLTMQALAEMEILLSPQYRNKLKLFRTFFGKEMYQSVLKEPEFIHYFAQMLAGTNLKKPVYDYMIDYYRLRGLNPQQLIPEAAELYHVLDAKRGMRGKIRRSIPYYIPIGVIAGLRAGIRNGAELTVELCWIMLICVVVAILMIWVYRKLYENHSSIFAQSMIAAFLLVSQIIVMFTGFYTPLLGEDGGILVAFLLFAAAGIWLICLGLAAVIAKIKEKSGK